LCDGGIAFCFLIPELGNGSGWTAEMKHQIGERFAAIRGWLSIPSTYA